jgi:hypothetical protein
MKANNILIAIVAFGVFISIGARAAGDSTVPDSANKEVKKNIQVVTFTVPDLSKSLAKDISKALASEPGVLSGKPDFERKAFLVTYESGKTSPMKIQKIMKAVTTDTKLENVAPAPEKSGAQGCGKCPRRNSCVKYNN